jgi:hypothetical protein
MTQVKIFGALAALIILIGGISILPRSQGESAEGSTSKLEARSLTKYGLEVIDPKNPAFGKMRAENKSGSVTVFSVFVANKSDKAIATCSLKWEIVLPAGQTVTHFQTKTGTLETISDDKGVHFTEGIPAKGNLLFSLTDSSNPNSQSGTGVGFRTGGENPDITDQLSRSVKVTVSIDGVLFTDGTYVGPDTNNYFELFKGQIEADRELDSEVDQLVNSGAPPEAITKHLKKIANTQSNDVQIPPGEDPQYSFGKWMKKSSYARLLLLMREKKDDQAFLDRIRADLAKPQINLRKIKES